MTKIEESEWPLIIEKVKAYGWGGVSEVAKEYGVNNGVLSRGLTNHGWQQQTMHALRPLQDRPGSGNYQHPRLIPLDKWEEIADRIMELGHGSMTKVAKEYGVSRERIRQIALAQGVTYQRIYQARMVAEAAWVQEILAICRTNPTATVAGLAQEYGMKPHKLKAIVRKHDPEGLEKWGGWSARHSWWGRQCSTCKIWKPRAEMAKAGTKEHTDGTTSRCKQCAAKQVDAIIKARHYPEPTVEYKLCHGCTEIKPADEFYRNTHDPSGLQSSCKPCQSKASKASEARKKAGLPPLGGVRKYPR